MHFCVWDIRVPKFTALLFCYCWVVMCAQVIIDLVKQPGRTLGFSIAGGRGSTPAYEDVDEVHR